MRISDHFMSTDTAESTHVWTLVSHDPSVAPMDATAATLAILTMEERCRCCPPHLAAWQERRLHGAALRTASAEALRAFVEPAFGLPESPGSPPKDHLEGYVAELLWFFLTRETPPEPLARLEPLGFAATDSGGDGLAIHRQDSGDLMFRLWEIKKNTGAASVSSTVNTAYGQLKAKATKYLARYATAAQGLALPPDMSALYSRLLDLWVDESEMAAAGIAVATSTGHLPSQCFSTFGDQFPGFISPVRLRGMLSAINDFPAFTEKVRGEVWRGL